MQRYELIAKLFHLIFKYLYHPRCDILAIPVRFPSSFSPAPVSVWLCPMDVTDQPQ